MHKILRSSLATLPLLAAFSLILPPPAQATDLAPECRQPCSGIAPASFDPAVRPQDDFYAWVNGIWARNAQIPPSRARWGTYDELREKAAQQVRAILDEVLREPGEPGSERRKIADLYRSFADTEAREKAGFAPLAPQLARIAQLDQTAGVPALMAELARDGVAGPLAFGVNQDARDATRYAVYVSQSGLGLPDRDYYLDDKDAKLTAARSAYRRHVAAMFKLQGDGEGEARADAVLELETRLARLQWTRVEMRDAVKAYNRWPLAQLDEQAAGLDWNAWLREAGLAGRTDALVVRQPSYVQGLAKLLADTTPAQWQSYFRWRVIEAYAPYLNRAAVDERFAFSGTALRGIPQNEPAWRLAQGFVDSVMGEAVGKLYVQHHFPPENKARVQAMVANFLAAFREGIDALPWMSPATQREAQAKLALFMPKIGYPDKWRDYSALQTSPGDLIANVKAGHRYAHGRGIGRLGQPVDRGEWSFTPQTVNASYSSLQNAITFPAALLQPPFFDVRAEDAINYGSVGTSIGHEISHGFDDQGSRYDGKGNLRDWWTPQDRAAFNARTQGLAAQYDAYSPVPGYHVNGRLTLGENIGDNAGVATAFRAYRRSLGGKPSPVIDGFTGEQRLFIGWAVKFRTLQREDAAIVQIKTDPHSPGEFRVKGALANQDAFYEAFGIREGDRMYRAPAQRVQVW